MNRLKGLILANWYRVARVILYISGITTFFFFFWSFIGLLIGISYFILSKDIAWKRNGVILSYSITFVTLLVFYYKAFPPLNLAIWSGLSIFLSFSISLLSVSIIKRKTVFVRNFNSRLSTLIKKIHSKPRLAIKVATIIAPLILWSSVNIDLEVMFDNNPRLLWVHAPSKVNIGETFELKVEVWDQFERLSAIYNGKVEFSLYSFNLSSGSELINPIVALPDPYIFTGQIFGSDIAYEIRDGRDNGMHNFEMSINTIGIHYVLVNDSITSNTYFSNPIMVKNYTSNEQLIAWGDLHSHTDISDGSGTLEHSFYYARYVAGLEFAALTEHGEIMMWNPGSLDQVERATNFANTPNEFVTFHGIEWTQVETGHYTCVFSGDKLLKNPILSYMVIPTTQGLWDALDAFTESTGARALALPHHTTKKTYIQDWTYLNPKYVKIVEVSSVHGDSLFEQRHPLNYRGAIDPPPSYTYGSSIMDAFRMGYRMTLYSSGDNHDGHPGHSLSHTRAYIGHQRPYSIWHTRNEHPYPGGLTAVFVNNITRESVFTGLENQQIYANSDHGRPILFFNINGTQVGQGSTLLVDDQLSHRKINILIAQDGTPVAQKSKAASVSKNWVPNWDGKIEIMKNGILWQSIDISAPIENISILDTDPIVGATFEPNCVEIDGKYYINSYSDNSIVPSTLNTGGFDFYVIRVVGDNGRMTWAGPIWVEY